MFKAAPRSKDGMPAQQPAGGLHRIRVTLRHLYTGISDVPIEAILYIGDELGRFEKAHVRLDASPLPDLFLMASKSAAVKGVAGWSADSSSQDSSAGVTLKVFSCCSRRDRRTSFTNSPGSSHAPLRTCSFRKSSTSLAKAMVISQFSGSRSRLSNILGHPAHVIYSTHLTCLTYLTHVTHVTPSRLTPPIFLSPSPEAAPLLPSPPLGAPHSTSPPDLCPPQAAA